MRIVFTWFKLCIAIVALANLSLFAQQLSIGELKAALVGQFVKHIEWPDSGQDNLDIIVLEDRAMYDQLIAIDNATINEKTIKVSFSSNTQNIADADIVYVSDKVLADVSNLLAVIRGKGTLVITENSDTLHNVMINIVTTEVQGSQQLSFQINRPNIAFEKLVIGPDLILHGGSDLDVASLYRETEQAMQTLRSRIADSQQELETKQQELDGNKQELTRQRQSLQQMDVQLKALTSEFEDNQRLLEQQKTELSDAAENYRLADAQYSIAREEANSRLLEAENDVQQQIAILADLERQISEKNGLLEEREAALQSKSEELIEKTETVEQQAQVIDTQYLIIIISAVILIVFAILAIIVARLYLKNKAITQQLSDTVLRLKETQSQLVESEKLASLGQMVAGVAHEINTPIGVVVTSSSKIGADAASFLKKVENQTLRRSEMEKFLSVLVETDHLIQRNLERCARLIQNFKQVSADQIVAENRDINLSDYISDVMNTLSVVLKQNRVSWTITGDNPPQFIDPGLLGQVVNNLVNNAITHGFIDVERREFKIKITHQEDYDEVVFSDNGIGMDEETQEKVFDPFFTTKRGTGGTGLGMNIVYNLVTTKLNGTIALTSSLKKGTEIRITLPAAPQEGRGEAKRA